jgi:hypothetical protein
MILPRLPIVLLFCFCSHLSVGQTRLIGDRLQKILTAHQYHCDAELKKFEPFLMHEEVPIKMLFLSYDITVDSLKISGRVADYTSEGMVADVFLATVSDSSCVLEQKLTAADMNGHFNVVVAKDSKRSLYFTSLSYQDLEVKLSKIIDLAE